MTRTMTSMKKIAARWSKEVLLVLVGTGLLVFAQATRAEEAKCTPGDNNHYNAEFDACAAPASGCTVVCG